MNPNLQQPPQNTGSFGAAAGGVSPELLAAIQRRQGAGAGASSQITGGSPSQSPQVPSQPVQGGQSMPQGGMPPDMSSAGAATGAGASLPMQFPFDPQETSIIVGALTNRLKAISDMGKAQLGVHPLQQPPEPPQPQAAPQGGM